jgi:hypothetical protein
MPPSYWFVVLGIIMAVPNGYTAEKLPVLGLRENAELKVYVFNILVKKTGMYNHSKPPSLYRVR